MPVISITLLPGYSAQAEERLVGRVALAARSVISAANAGTTVFVNHAHTYQRDGRVFSKGGPECADASALVREFLGLMRARDLPAAAKLLAPGFVMQFPGNARMHQLEELLGWAKGRYSSITKDYERFDESWADGVTVVYCSGTLRGVWLDGSAFSDIRFIDRFEIADGLIRRQDVWNDLAEASPRSA
ncbi:nuclear transport factor 2 family protein [Polaromonas sp. P1-6]|nr:nuclear transport factor 2 family protein [Polaromonas sp. P1-6]